jgi:hypothetical protein
VSDCSPSRDATSKGGLCAGAQCADLNERKKRTMSVGTHAHSFSGVSSLIDELSSGGNEYDNDNHLFHHEF